MSRLIVKNLPKNYSSEKLKEHFSQKGHVTDAALAKTGDGKTRRFGFVGFRTDKEADDAIKYFNNTYIYTSKISVEKAKSSGDKSINRAWSKYTEGTSAYNKAHGIDPVEVARKEREERIEASRAAKKAASQASGKDEGDVEFGSEFSLHNRLQAMESKGDEKLTEYMSVMGGRKSGDTGRVWANDDVLLQDATIKGKNIKASASKTAEDDDLYEDIPSMSKKTEDEGNDEEDTTKETDSGIEGVTDVKVKSTTNSDAKSSKGKKESDATAQDAQETTVEKKENAVPMDVIADTGRLFVKNIPYTCTTKELEDHFSEFGPITEVHIPITVDTKKPKGFAFVQFMFPDRAARAYMKLDGSIFQGRLLKLYPGMDRSRNEEEENEDNLNYKQRKERERKKNAVKEFTWNSLFMNSDAVTAAIAKKLNVTKSDILNPEDNGLAVRLALAETHIITETKEYLIQAGVDLNAFEKNKERSKTIILVKNIPADTEENELEEMFGAIGTLSRIVLPPAKTIAMVEFIEPNEAKSAFLRLAYKKLHHIPMFLEWAPIGSLKPLDPNGSSTITGEKGSESESSDVSKDSSEEKDMSNMDQEQRRAASGIDSTAAKDTLSGDKNKEDEEIVGSATLFVKNLSFKTDTDGLKEAFAGVKGFLSARVSTKIHGRTGETLSMGFGFLNFSAKEDAMECMKRMQNFKLDGHALQLKLSQSTSKNGGASNSKKGSDTVKVGGTKLIIRNIPFEATKRDVQQLFRSFGQVKSLRLPKKFDGSHRGFGFIDFLTKQEAKNAFETLGSTHLYGRHLVLEWADEKAAGPSDEGANSPSDPFADVESKKRSAEEDPQTTPEKKVKV